jgi:2-polyprenyl-6-methoxyphenol hydroxylase-like FAD-dependent oxidoreductase
VAEFDDIQTGGTHLPATMGMERRELARILVAAAEGHGANIRLGLTVDGLTSDETDNPDGGVDVTFSDGSTGRYDIVIGADGLKSKTRELIGVTERPEPTGMGIWRIFTSRPESITRTDLCFAGPCYIAGYCPTAEDSIYAYLVEDNQDRTGMSPEERLDYVRQLAGPYGGPWNDIKDLMTDPASIHYTWFDHMLIEGPWWRGRTILIGDAAHTCPPTIAQGAAQALEDAQVLAQTLLAHDSVPGAFDAFLERRLPRAKTVVEASVQVGQWMMDDDPDGDIPGLMGRTLSGLIQPA